METSTESGSASAVIENEPLTPHEIAAFLEGRLEGKELTRVESYLADHPHARQELIKASRIIQSAPPKESKRSRRLYPLIGLAAAAAIAVMFIRPAGVNQLSAPVSTERRGLADEPERIVLISPVDAGEIKDREEPLTWNSVDNATYQVAITDPAGNTILRTNTSDTSLVLPESVRAGTYYWRVDARSPDGASSTSGFHEFRVIGQ